MKLSRDNVMQCVLDYWQDEQVIPVRSVVGKDIGEVFFSVDDVHIYITPSEKLGFRFTKGVRCRMNGYDFVATYVDVSVPFRKRTVEDLMVHEKVVERIFDPMTHAKTSSTLRYYHCKCCNNLEGADNKNATLSYPHREEWDNVIRHKQAVLEYFRDSPLEADKGAYVAGFMACLFTRIYSVGKRIPADFVEGMKSKFEEIGLTRAVENVFVSENELALVFEQFYPNSTKVYCSTSFVAQRFGDDYKRVTLNKSLHYRLWRDLTM